MNVRAIVIPGTIGSRDRGYFETAVPAAGGASRR